MKRMLFALPLIVGLAACARGHQPHPATSGHATTVTTPRRPRPMSDQPAAERFNPRGKDGLCVENFVEIYVKYNADLSSAEGALDASLRRMQAKVDEGGTALTGDAQADVMAKYKVLKDAYLDFAATFEPGFTCDLIMPTGGRMPISFEQHRKTFVTLKKRTQKLVGTHVPL